MMNKMRAIVSLFLLFPLLMSAQEAPRGLRVDLLEHPDSIFVSGQQAVVSSTTPYFSWECGSGMAGGRQAAWRILVASAADRLTEGKADVWDSGRQKSSSSTAVCYGGKALRPSSCYFWTVQTFDRQAMPVPGLSRNRLGLRPFSTAVLLIILLLLTQLAL